VNREAALQEVMKADRDFLTQKPKRKLDYGQRPLSVYPHKRNLKPQIFELIAKGETNANIARRLRVSPAYISRIRRGVQ
jgi:DNA-binding NarL/FixJ family response regulator